MTDSISLKINESVREESQAYLNVVKHTNLEKEGVFTRVLLSRAKVKVNNSMH